GLRNVLARVVIDVELRLGGRAGALAHALVLGELARHGGERDRIVVPVAGPHAQSPERPRRRRRIGADIRARPFAGTEPRREEAARLGRGLAVLRTAIVLRQRLDQGLALAAAVGAAGLQLLQVAEHAVEIGAHLADARGELTALRRLAAEQGEE